MARLSRERGFGGIASRASVHWLSRRLTKWILRRRPEEGAVGLELSAALLLWLNLFQLIVVLVVGRSVGSALFLQRFDARGLALLYVFVGLTVAGLVAVFDRMGRRFGQAAASLAGVGALEILMLSAGVFFPAASEQSDRWLFGAFYLLVESFAFVATVQFWAQANCLLSVEQAGRLYIFIGTGGIFGSLAGGWLTYQTADQPAQLALRLLACLIPLQLLTVAAFSRLRPRLADWRPKDFDQWNLDGAAVRMGLARAHAGPPPPTRDSFTEPPPTLSRALGLVSLLMVFGTTMVDFYYKMLANRRFEGNSSELTSFFGGFYFCVGAATLLVQTLLTPQIFRRTSAYWGLSASPALLGLLAIWNLTQPGVWSAAGFKLVDSVLSHSVYRSCQEVLYTPLPTSWVQRLKLSADGVFGRSGLLLAGVVLFGAAPWLEQMGPQALLPGVVVVMVLWGAAVWRLRVVFRRCAAERTGRRNFVNVPPRRLAG